MSEPTAPAANDGREPDASGPDVLTASARSFATTRGALLGGLPAPLLWHAWLTPGQPVATVVASVAALCLAVGAANLPRRPDRGRALASAGVLLACAPLTSLLFSATATVFGAALAAATVLASLWASDERWASRQREDEPALFARGAAGTSLCLVLLSLLSGRADDVASAALIGAASLAASALSVRWALLNRAPHRGRATILLGACAIALGGWVANFGHLRGWLLAGSIPAVAAVLVLPRRLDPVWTFAGFWEPVLAHPARLLVVTFAGLSVTGTALLALPASTHSGHSIGLLDAAFTAVSAACVTGLVVRDTAATFNGLGQAIILLLIQVGGLGIMAFSTAALRVFRVRMPLRHESAVARLLNADDRGELYEVARRLFVFTLAAEFVGAAVLTSLFAGTGMALSDAFWAGSFTAISAFCNAGFALFSDSLVGMQREPAILHTVAILVVFGGLSPLAALSIPRLLRRRRVRSQHRIALYTTALLLVLGFVLTLTIEWSHALGHLSFADRFHNAWFHSVTLRTAGFNSLDLTSMQPPTISFMLVWMAIGGSPGGTAGGLKTTTVALLVLAANAAVRGRSQVVVFSRKISHDTVYKAVAIATAGLAAAFFGVFSLLLTQPMPADRVVFEAVSALGTVGLSLDASARLDGVGKVIVTLLMFAGRVGPLTLFMFLTQRTRPSVWRYPEEEIEVG